MIIKSYPDVATCSVEAGEYLSGLLEQFAQDSVLLLCSGGSALHVLDKVYADINFENIFFGVVDERFTVERGESNLLKLQQTDFYKFATSKGASCIVRPVNASGSLQEAATIYNLALENWQLDHRFGKIIVILGIGEDGHTAGIFPMDNEELFNKLFLATSRQIIGYSAGESTPITQERITMTLSALKEVDYSIVYAVGESKKSALHKVIKTTGELYKVPARIIHAMKYVKIFSDQM